MIDQPKTINVPGIDQPLREQTLAEFVMAVDENHLVRRELRELQNRAFRLSQLEEEYKSVSRQLEDMKGAFKAAQDEIATLRAGAAGTPMIQPADIPNIAGTVPIGSTQKVPCPFCGKLTSASPGPWASHMRAKHNLVGKDCPPPFVAQIPSEVPTDNPPTA